MKGQHDHDDHYYTKLEVDALLAGKADIDHTYENKPIFLASPADGVKDPLDEWTYTSGYPDESLVKVVTTDELGPNSYKVTIDSGGQTAGLRLVYAPHPTTIQEAGYSCWFYVPEHVEHPGWFWNIWQYKMATYYNNQHSSKPGVVVNIVNRRDKLRILVSNGLQPGLKLGEGELDVPVGEWFRLEADHMFHDTDGYFTLYQDGSQIVDAQNIPTSEDVGYPAPTPIWQGRDLGKWEWTVNNYTENTVPAVHDLYIRDAVVTRL